MISRASILLTLTAFCRVTQSFLPVNQITSRTGGQSLQADGTNNVERIEYKIYPDGRVEQKVIGVKGGECVKLTEELNNALGEIISSEPTEDMFEQTVELDQTLSNIQSEGNGNDWKGASSW